MKTLIALIAACILSVNAIADNPNYHGDKYCAKMKNGKTIVMYEGSTLTADVTLSNGTKVRTDGTIIKPDGTKTTLKEGECISKEGVMAEDKHKKDNSK